MCLAAHLEVWTGDRPVSPRDGNLRQRPCVGSRSRMTYPKTVAYSLLAILVALYVVGAVSVPPGSLRHEVQTLPLWVPMVVGFQNRELAKWAALPCLIFWLTIMIFIW